eukprot:11162957-Lingulodinium_polyedra.AAC.1
MEDGPVSLPRKQTRARVPMDNGSTGMPKIPAPLVFRVSHAPSVCLAPLLIALDYVGCPCSLRC